MLITGNSLMNRKRVKISVFNQCTWSCGITLSDYGICVLTEAFKIPLNSPFCYLPPRDFIVPSKLFFVSYLWNSFTNVKGFIMSYMLVLTMYFIDEQRMIRRAYAYAQSRQSSGVRAVAAIKHREWNYRFMLLASHHFFTFKYVIWQTVKTQKKCHMVRYFMRVHTAC